MIPTLVLFGVIFGRWWRTSVILGMLGWPAVLLATGTVTSVSSTAGAAGLALLNTGAGVLVHQAALRAVRALRRQRVHASSTKI